MNLLMLLNFSIQVFEHTKKPSQRVFHFRVEIFKVKKNRTCNEPIILIMPLLMVLFDTFFHLLILEYGKNE